MSTIAKLTESSSARTFRRDVGLVHQHHALPDIRSPHTLQRERDALSGLRGRHPRPDIWDQHTSTRGDASLAPEKKGRALHLPLSLDGLDDGAVEVSIRVRPEEHGVPRLDRARVEDAIDDGADVRHRVHFGDRVLQRTSEATQRCPRKKERRRYLEGLVGQELLVVALAGRE